MSAIPQYPKTAAPSAETDNFLCTEAEAKECTRLLQEKTTAHNISRFELHKQICWAKTHEIWRVEGFATLQAYLSANFPSETLSLRTWNDDALAVPEAGVDDDGDDGHSESSDGAWSAIAEVS